MTEKRRRLRIGLDVMVTPSVKTGVGRYIDGLLTGLAQDEGNEYEYVIFAGRNQTSLPELPVCDFAVRRAGVSTEHGIPTFLWRLLVLPWLLKKDSIDVLHVLNEKPLLCPSVPTVMTIHDIGDYRYPKRSSWARRLYRRMVLPRTVNTVDHLIAVSATTKNDLVELLGVHPTRVTVTNEGVSDQFKPGSKKDAQRYVADKWGMSQEFVLFVGEIDVRKNLLGLVRAMDIVVCQHKLQVGLVMAGKYCRGTDLLHEEIAKLKLGGSVVLTGYVTEHDLLKLYNAASVCVLPSWYEGFGLPALEAMACGTPVIASRSGALQEVVGDAGVLVDVAKEDELPRAIATVLTDEALRRELITRGLLRSKDFTWPQAAAATREAYRLVAPGDRLRSGNDCPEVVPGVAHRP